MKIDLFKEKLIDRKSELEARIEALERDKQRQGKALEADSEERAVQLQNDEVVDHLDQLEIKELNLVNNALKRIDENNYGVCLNCGDVISEKRLMAAPAAHNCMSCQSDINQESL